MDSDPRTIVITEKPSVAQTIAAVLGATQKKKGCFTGNGYIVSWCIGHLVELSAPDKYDPKYKTWRKADLPITPVHWKYEVCEKTREQFEILKSYLNSPDVDTVVCATDAGREGELIFRLVYEAAGCNKPVKRLWISSLEESAVREGFQHLHDGSEYDNLYQAALCRSRADWLVGMNASRLYSILYGQPLNVGRVVTPTLALLTEREQTIAHFQPETFYTVLLSCGFPARSKRIRSKEDAEKIRAACHLKTAIVRSVERTSHTNKPPYLYDLTTLQRDANRIFGFTAQQTLDYAQHLYERKLITYPRTDSRYLTRDMTVMLSGLVRQTATLLPHLAGLDLAIREDRVIDDAKVTDHHAIIPTKSVTWDQLQTLPAGEKRIFDMIATRMVCAVGDDYCYERTAVTVACEGFLFTATGKTTTRMGWLAPSKTFMGSVGAAGPSEGAEKELVFPELTVGQALSPVMAKIEEGQTTMPTHYSEDKLLAAMETAGADAIPDEAERKGIGTPATRAGIIEKLIAANLAERQGNGKVKYLVPTDKGKSLIHVLPETLASPMLTAEWEQRLLAIERGKDDPNVFMQDIARMLTALTATAERVPDADKLFPPLHPKLGVCPVCGSDVLQHDKGAFCSSDVCNFGIWWDRKFFTEKRLPVTPDLVKELLEKGSVYCKALWSPTKNKTYSARIKMEVTEDGKPSFKLQFGS